MNIVNTAIKDIESKNNYLMDSEKLKSNKSHWNNGLHGACQGGHFDIIILLIKKGANDWNSGLYGACKGGHLNIVKLMINCGAGMYMDSNMFTYFSPDDYINFTTNAWNIGLGYACEGGHLYVVNFLIEKGADNWNGGLVRACAGGHSEIVKLMIRRGADNLNHAICNIFYMIDSDIVELLIEKNVSLDRLYLCYSKDKLKISKLLEFGMPINKFKNIFGFSNLMKDIKERQNTMKNILHDHIIRDLTGIIVEYVVY